MSWFKKIIGLQYDFNSQSSSQDSSQVLSQEPKTYCTKQKMKQMVMAEKLKT